MIYGEPKFKIGQEVVIPSLESYGEVVKITEYLTHFIYSVQVDTEVIEFCGLELERA